LPTYRWDDWDTRTGTKVSDDEDKLRASTSALLLEYLREESESAEGLSRPPIEVITPIVNMNIDKRTAATKRAEVMVEQGVISRPPVSLIPTFMASGHAIIGVEDGYMRGDHPSQELFAYNRVGKKSWLNRRFGEHCLKAISFAHPGGLVEPAVAPTRVKAHSTDPIFDQSIADMNEDWKIVSSKTPIAVIRENGRSAALISRVTGAVDLASEQLSDDERIAIHSLAEQADIHTHDATTTLGNKALLLSALERSEESQDNPFHPVIQTVYLTQLAL
jgi:hypothetical protein